MSARIITVGLLCALIALVLWPAPSDRGPEAGMAGSMQGEHWYRLSLEGRHLGYWRTRNQRDDTGNWVFESEQRFALHPTERLSTTTRRVFDGEPPYRLLAAEQVQTRRGRASGIRIEARPEGYVASRVPPDGTPERRLDLDYHLADYLEFELWLDTRRPLPGDRRTVDTLDFDRVALVGRGFDVVASDEVGYVVENAAPLAATRIELDTDYVPRRIRIAGLFDLTRTSRGAALAPRSTLQAASYYVPADRRLMDHDRISRLVLGIDGVDTATAVFPDAKAADDGWRLALTAPPVTGGPVTTIHRAETAQIPSRHPEIGALAAAAVAGYGSGIERARALTDFVHRYLSYDPGESGQAVIDLLSNPRGDCTEYADLLTTLARSLGMPARTVFGLAYADGAEPAFAYHAWNELFVDGSWVSVDPTWGQHRVDATHIPLPADETIALALLTGSLALSFSVLEVEHFQD